MSHAAPKRARGLRRLLIASQMSRLIRRRARTGTEGDLIRKALIGIALSLEFLQDVVELPHTLWPYGSIRLDQSSATTALRRIRLPRESPSLIAALAPSI